MLRRDILRGEARQVDRVDGEDEEAVRLSGDEIVVIGDDENMASVRQVRSKRQAFDLLREGCLRDKRGLGGVCEVEEVDEGYLRHGGHPRRGASLREGGYRHVVANVGGARDVDLEDLLERRAVTPVAVALDHQELMIVDGQDLVDAVRLEVELIQKLTDGAGPEVYLHDSVVRADPGGRPRSETVILEQRALHDPVELRPVRRDREPLHPTVGLAPADVVQELRIPVGRGKVDEELVRHRDHAAAPTGGEVELVDERSVLIRNESRLSARADPDSFRVEAETIG